MYILLYKTAAGPTRSFGVPVVTGLTWPPAGSLPARCGTQAELCGTANPFTVALRHSQVASGKNKLTLNATVCNYRLVFAV